MDPQQNIPNPNTVLQPLQPEAAVVPSAPPEIAPLAPAEAASLAPEIAPVPGQAQPASAMPTAVSAAAVPATPPPAQTLHTGSVDGRSLGNQALQNLPAADEDLIEKEWVDTVEDVIEKDEDNPYIEDKDHAMISQTYVKKRFNLDVS